MRITGISAFNISSKNTFEQKRDASALNKSFIQLPMDTFNRQAADISFNANVITSQSKFKNW